MNKEQQDKLWNELSEEYKDYIRERYLKLRDTAASADCMLTELFGSHNLNPKPPTPKTWEDVEKYYKAKSISTDYYVNFECGMEERIADKMIATAKIAKLIELSYGGVVTEEEWKDLNIPKYCIIYHPTCQDERLKFDDDEEIHTEKYFIAFHTPEQREEFMSYESNRKLVEMYYLM